MTILTKLARAAERDMLDSPPLPIPRFVYVAAAVALTVGGSVYLAARDLIASKFAAPASNS